MNDEQFAELISVLKGIKSELSNIGCGMAVIVIILGFIVGTLIK